MRMLKMPDGRIKILVQGVARARTEKVLQEEPFLKVQVRRMREHEPAKGDLEVEALVRSVKEQMQKVATMGKVVLPDIMLVAENLDDPGRLSDLLGSNLGLRVHDAQAILEVADPVARLRRVNELLAKEISLLEMQEKITSRAKGEIDKSQREYYLREQLKAIQKELGETDERSGEMAELRQKIDAAGMPEAVQDAGASSSSTGSPTCTRTPPRPRCCAPTSTGSSSCPGAARRPTTSTSRPPSRCSTRTTTTSRRSRRASSSTSRCASCASR